MNDQAPPKKRTWLWVLLGVCLLIVVIGAGGLFFAVSFFRQAMNVTDATQASADTQFESVRAKFAGQQPLIQLVDGKPEYIAERATAPAAEGTRLTTMHAMAWDDDEGKLVTFALPFWLLRLKSGPIRLSAYSQGWDDRGVSFRIEDIEKHGPGLLLDVSEPNEGRVLIWAE
jgi:hypothetical protein